MWRLLNGDQTILKLFVSSNKPFRHGLNDLTRTPTTLLLSDGDTVSKETGRVNNQTRFAANGLLMTNVDIQVTHLLRSSSSSSSLSLSLCVCVCVCGRP